MEQRYERLLYEDLQPGDIVPGVGTVEWVEVYERFVDVDWTDGRTTGPVKLGGAGFSGVIRP